MLEFVLRRALLAVFTIVAVSVIVFGATQALPSDPARAILGRSATPQSVAALRVELHLNRSVTIQYVDWLWGAVRGNFGNSLAARGEPVSAVLGGRLENSAFLFLISALFSVPISVGLGVLLARRRDGWIDRSISLVLLILAALPEFVVALLLVALFATTVLHVLPAVSVVDPTTRPWANPAALVLPTVTLVLAVSPYIARIVRASMIDVLASDFVEMARLKGLPEREVILRHALPSAFAPAIQAIALNLAYLAGGLVIVEFVFAFPGIGSAFVDAVANRDLPVVQALALTVAAVYVVLNLGADIATILVSPRLRTGLR